MVRFGMKTVITQTGNVVQGKDCEKNKREWNNKTVRELKLE